jgi:hypothetical protein
MKVRERHAQRKNMGKFFEPERILCIMELNHNVEMWLNFGSADYGHADDALSKTIL